jgi:alpha-1,2-mannosyltransferase
MGHDVVLGTIDQTSWGRVNGIMGAACKPDEEIWLIGFNSSILRVYTSTLMPLIHSKLSERCDYVVCTNLDVMPQTVDIGYMHYLPLCKMLYHRRAKPYSWNWYLYSFVGQKIQGRYLKAMKTKKVLTNSHFSRRAIRESTGIDAEVVYPPVDLEKFRPPLMNSERRKEAVTLGRLSPEKNLGFVLRLAEMTPDVKFNILASLAGAYSRPYLKSLLRVIEKRNLANVHMHVNLPSETVRKIMHSSLILLHATRNEHFGLAVVEGIASGLVPVVHRSGGAWEDILAGSEGIHGFSYEGLEEAKKKIRIVTNDSTTLDKMRSDNLSWAKNFSAENFRQRIQSVVRTIT